MATLKIGPSVCGGRESAEVQPGAAWQWQQSYDYDGIGNRTAVNGWGPLVDPATNRFTAATGYSYDANGNVTVMPGVGVDKQMEWDVLGEKSEDRNQESVGAGLSCLWLGWGSSWGRLDGNARWSRALLFSVGARLHKR